jgi:hypothetical protein
MAYEALQFRIKTVSRNTRSWCHSLLTRFHCSIISLFCCISSQNQNGGVFISNVKFDDGAPEELFQCFLLPAVQRNPLQTYVKSVSPYAVEKQSEKQQSLANNDWHDLNVTRLCHMFVCFSFIFDSLSRSQR